MTKTKFKSVYISDFYRQRGYIGKTLGHPFSKVNRWRKPHGVLWQLLRVGAVDKRPNRFQNLGLRHGTERSEKALEVTKVWTDEEMPIGEWTIKVSFFWNGWTSQFIFWQIFTTLKKTTSVQRTLFLCKCQKCAIVSKNQNDRWYIVETTSQIDCLYYNKTY